MASQSRTQPSRAQLMLRLQTDVAETVADGVALEHAMAGHLGLSSSDLRAVTALMRTGTAAAGDLAEASNLTTGAATRMIDRLVATGWVVRRADERDRRRVLVSLRKERRSELGELYAEMSASWSQALADKSEDELASVLELFERMREVSRRQTAVLRG
ncbi:MAG: MarR family transcriptional regulator [Rhodoglobus sp.]